jgi:HlyD family secretion protein
LLALEISEGDVVKEGTFIGLVDTTDLYLRVLQIEKQQKALDTRISSINSQIRVQQQQLDNLNIEKSRIESLFGEGAATKQQLDDVNGKHDLLVEQIASTRVSKETVLAEKGTLDVQKEQVGESIRKCYIRNPIDGTVLDKYAEAGEVTAFGKPLYKIANLDEIRLRVYISGAQLPDVKLGQEVQVLIDQGEKGFSDFTGRVSWISPEAEFTPKIIQTKEERVNLVYAVKVLVKNDGTLKIGMPGEVNFN